MFGQEREDFCNKSCPQCDQPLVGTKPQSLVLGEDKYWYHEGCLLRAKRAFAAAMKLAHLGYIIAEYCATRENIDAP